MSNYTEGIRRAVGEGFFYSLNVVNHRPARLFAQVRWIAGLGFIQTAPYPFLDVRTVFCFETISIALDPINGTSR